MYHYKGRVYINEKAEENNNASNDGMVEEESNDGEGEVMMEEYIYVSVYMCTYMYSNTRI